MGHISVPIPLIIGSSLA